MTMTKKHFIAFAREIAESNHSPETRMFAALVVIRIAERDNPRFDRARFLTACGLGKT